MNVGARLAGESTAWPSLSPLRKGEENLGTRLGFASEKVWEMRLHSTIG